MVKKNERVYVSLCNDAVTSTYSWASLNYFNKLVRAKF